MNLRQAYLGMIKAFPGGWDSIAAALGMTRDALENRVYERRNQTVSVDLAQQMQKFSGTTLFAEAIAAESGGVFTRLVDVAAITDENLHEKFQELYKNLGILSSQYIEFTSDNDINKAERAKLEATADQIHKTIQELMGLMFHVFCKHDGEKLGAA